MSDVGAQRVNDLLITSFTAIEIALGRLHLVRNEEDVIESTLRVIKGAEELALKIPGAVNWNSEVPND